MMRMGSLLDSLQSIVFKLGLGR